MKHQSVPKYHSRNIRRRHTFITFIILLLAAGTASAQWRQFVPDGYTTAIFGGCSMATQEKGFAIAALGAAQGIMATTDGGRSWTGQQVNGMWLFDIHFTDEKNGFVVGRWNTYQCGLILRTTNGGLQWTADTSQSTHGFYTVSFPTARTGYTGGYLGTIMKTTNGGARWNRLNTGTEGHVFTRLAFPAADTGYALAGKDGKFFSPTDIFRTVDGGANWQIVHEFDENRAATDIFFTSGTTGYLVGQDERGEALMKTVDGGISWRPIYRDPRRRFITTIKFLDERSGWAIGDTGLIVRTTDAGATWTDESFSTESMLIGIDFMGSTALAVGYDGLVLQRILGAASVDITEAEESEIAIIPNPLADAGMVNIPLAGPAAPYTFIMYDIRGMEVRRSTGITDGNNIPVHRGDLPAGTYLFRVITGNDIVGRGRVVIR